MTGQHALAVWQTTKLLARVGRPNDGGYVLALGLLPDAFLSGGIADDCSFECGALDLYPHLTCEAFDPGSQIQTPDRLRLHTAKVDYTGLEAARNALVKIDIEGDEWEWLRGAPLAHVAQLVVELHWQDGKRWDWGVLERLAATHWLIWAHGNNWDGFWDMGQGFLVPGTLETTWVRKDLNPNLSLSRRPIPGPLDQPNRAGLADIVIDYPPFVNREEE